MAKRRQILEMRPQMELHFSGVSAEDMSTELELRNPTDCVVCFRVDNKDRKSFSIKPNSGFIEPFSDTTVEITLRPNTKVKDNTFTVESMFAPEGEVDLKTVWREVAPNQITETQLNSTFDLCNSFEAIDANISAKSLCSALFKCVCFPVEWFNKFCRH